MNTAVAVTDQICRTMLYLASIGAVVKLAPAVLPRLQVASPRGQGRQAGRSGPGAVLEEQGDRGAAG